MILVCKTEISIAREQDILYFYISLVMSHIACVGPMMTYNVETRRSIQHKNLVVSTFFYVTISPCTLYHSCPVIQASDSNMFSSKTSLAFRNTEMVFCRTATSQEHTTLILFKPANTIVDSLCWITCHHHEATNNCTDHQLHPKMA